MSCTAAGEPGIVSRSGAAPVYSPSPAEEAGRGNVAFLCVDYFASTIWQMEHTLNAYARQLGFTARNYRLQRDSDRSGLLRDVARTENLRGVVLMSSPIISKTECSNSSAPSPAPQ